MAIALENAGAERGALLLPGDAGFELAAVCCADGSGSGSLPQHIPLESAGAQIPVSLLRWVERTRVPVILDDALVFTDDDRIERMFDALHRQADDLQIIVLQSDLDLFDFGRRHECLG